MPYGKRKFDDGGSSYGKRSKRKIAYRKKKTLYKKMRSRGGMAKMIKQVMLKQCETKHSQFTLGDNVTLEHNQYTLLQHNLCYLNQGDSHDTRNGDTVYARGLKLKLYIENQQYRPFARYAIVVLRDKQNPNSTITTGTNLWEGVTTSKNLDFFDFNRYEFKVIKRVNVSAPNSGSSLALGGTVDGVANVESSGESYEVMGNGSRYVNIWIPLNYHLKYLDGTNQPAQYRWQIGIIAYGSHGATTSGGTYPIGHVTGVGKFYFKDP